MAFHDLKDKEGRVFAFEVDNLFLSRKEVQRVIESIKGVRLLSHTRDDIFLTFEVEGLRFEAWEPFGGNTRYWIGPEAAAWCEQLERVRSEFSESKKKEPNQSSQPTSLTRRG